MTDDQDSGLPPPPAERPPADNVGSARMLADGTLELMLRSVSDNGTIGEALRVVPPGDPRYTEYVAHLGGLQPGGECAIPPFRPKPFEFPPE